MKKANKKTIKKIMALSLSFCLIMISSHPIYAEGTAGVFKEETVYGILNADGTPAKLIVSEFVHSTEKMDAFSDRSSLEEIRNLRSDALPEISEEDLLWQVDGYELNYQGISHQDLPVTTDISYFLDGKQISTTEIEGKSGDLKIIIHQQNNQSEEIEISGKTRTVYAPYYTVATLRLDANTFTDVEINQGKITNDGSNFIVLGLLAPGMADNFKDMIELDIQSELVITAKVDQFKFEPIYLAMSGKIPEIDDIKALDQLELLTKSLAEFQDAGNKLVQGATDLNAGQQTYFEKFDSGVAGLSTFLSSVSGLSAKLLEMDTPVKKLSSGMKTLAEGLSNFQTKSKPLMDGFQAYSEGAKTFSDGATLLSQQTDLLSDSLAKLPGSVMMLTEASQGISNSLVSIDTKLSGVSTGSDALYTSMKAFQSKLDSESDAYKAYETILKEMENLTASTAGLSGGVHEISEKTTAYNAGMSEFSVKISALEAAPKLIEATADKLSSASNKLSGSASALQTGSTQLASGMSELVMGSRQLEQGLIQLENGVSLMSNNLPKLNQATRQLDAGFLKLQSASGDLMAGSQTLKEGMIKFNKEGIQAMTQKLTVNEDKIDEALEIKEALLTLSQKFSTFSGSPEGVVSSVNYLLKVSH